MDGSFWKRKPRVKGDLSRREQEIVAVAKLMAEQDTVAMRSALNVLVKSRIVRDFLEKNDPQALRQALRALGEDE